MPLPPLRTVARGPAPGTVAPPRPAPPPAVAAPPPGADARLPGADARLPAEARGFVHDCLAAGLLSPGVGAGVVARVGDRRPLLTPRERAADAAVAHGLLTRYQADRAAAGQARSLVLGNYRLRERISGGTVGIVFRAEHAVMNRPVAVKVLPVDDTASPELVARFQAEVRMLATVCHPHVVAAYDAGLVPAAAPGEADLHYLVLELVPGGDLENHVYAHGVRPPAMAAEWGRQLAAGLAAAHAAGLVHRDVKPANVLLTAGGEAKLTDFGLARDLVGGSATRPGKLLGTLEFMAPEQVADAPTAGPPADVYGLGATLFWVLTGRLPFDPARTTAEALDRIRAGGPKRLRQIDPTLPAELDALLARMLARNPADRPTAREVADALDPLAGGGDPRTTVGELRQALAAKAADADKLAAGLCAGLAAVAATRPGEPAGHQKRVAAYTRALATVLAGTPEWGMFADPAQVDDLLRAAAAHDLGLVGVPEHLLAGGPPAAADRPAVDAHPRHGADVLFAVARACGPALPALRTLRAVVRNHHERWDGAGFPDRLAGPDIPPAARLVAVAVAYDDLRRAGHPHPDAVDAVRADSGRAFDPQVVAALLDAEGECERVYAVLPDQPAAVA